nr:sigma factor-like helix-turn-helix DNA-binding protein [Streptomyces chartreusis]
MTMTETLTQDTTDEDLLAELLVIRRQFRQLEASPLVASAQRLTRTFGPVFEPVWAALADASLDDGVGYLRQYGTGTTTPAVRRANAAVAAKAVRTYRKINLVGPDRHQIWAALSNPADTIMQAAAAPLPSTVAGNDNTPRPTALYAAVRPCLPAVLHLGSSLEDQIVPALRAVLRRWCDLAHRAGGTSGDHARIMLAAALLARGAALDGDIETVRWFVNRWLGLAAVDARVDGTTAALLENHWTRHRVDTRLSEVIDDVAKRLRQDADQQHRLHRPLWETQLRGARITLLTDHTPDVVSAEPNGEETAALADEVRSLLAQLPAETGRLMYLVHAYGYSPAEAGRLVGITEAAVRSRVSHVRRLFARAASSPAA